MNFSSTEAGRYLDALGPLVAGIAGCELFVLPSFTSIWVARERLQGSSIAWGAQDVHPDDDGAHTGDISATMLADLGCTYIEVGHSERRRDHRETDDDIARKVRQVVAHGMIPIVCVGEPLPGSADAAVEQVTRQVEAALGLVDRVDWRRVVIAYEPVWAIGVGARPADPAHIGAVQRAIRASLGTAADASDPTGQRARVIYGGSVDAGTAGPILDQDGVDGLFVGRAALDPAQFAAIVRIANGRANRAVSRGGATSR